MEIRKRTGRLAISIPFMVAECTNLSSLSRLTVTAGENSVTGRDYV